MKYDLSHKGAEMMKIEKVLDEATENNRCGLHANLVHLPFKITQDCPNCGVPCVRNLSEQSWASVIFGAPMNLYGYCTECEHEWKMLVKAEISLTPYVEQR